MRSQTKFLLDHAPERLLPDKGCNLFPSCLSCHLPVYRYDGLALVNKQRDQKIRMLRQSGLGARKVSEQMGLHIRTVERILYAKTDELE